MHIRSRNTQYDQNNQPIQASLITVGGTSFSTPTWAGSFALVEQYLKNTGVVPTRTIQGNVHPRMGRIQDLIYMMRGKTSVWHDITRGSISNPKSIGYSAAPGWDFTSGWGSVDFMNLNLELFQDELAFIPEPSAFSGIYDTSTTSPFQVTLSIRSSSNGTRVIYYTTDGSDPSDVNNTSRLVYSSAISFPNTGIYTIRAVTVATISGCTYQSSEMFETYYLRPAGSSPYYLYVNQAISSSGTGNSWTQAKKTIGEALQFAKSGDKVYVAKGTYLENISIPSGVMLYGGFNSGNTFSQRNPRTKVTIIDGSNQQNSMIKVSYGADSNTLVDGFTIQSGHSLSDGGINCTLSQVKVNNNVFCTNVNDSLPFETFYLGGCGIFFSCTGYDNAINPIITTGFCTALDNKLYKNTFAVTDNRSMFGSGIEVSRCSSALCSNNDGFRIADNLAYDNGVQFSDGTYPAIARTANGMIQVHYSYGTLANNTVSNTYNSNTPYNTDSSYSSGINVTGSVTKIANNIVTNCSAGIVAYNSYSNPYSTILSHNDVFANYFYDTSQVPNVYILKNYKPDPPLLNTSNDLTPIDPSFVDSYNDNYHLSIAPYSSCINSGYNTYVLSGELDLDGLSRIWQNQFVPYIVDLGAYEIHTNDSGQSIIRHP